MIDYQTGEELLVEMTYKKAVDTISSSEKSWKQLEPSIITKH